MTTTFNRSANGNQSNDLVKDLVEELKKLNKHMEQQLRNQPHFSSANSQNGSSVPTTNNGSQNGGAGKAPDPYAQHQSQQNTVANPSSPDPTGGGGGKAAAGGGRGLLGKAAGLGKTAFSMSGGFIGVGLMALTTLPMLFMQGTQKAEELNKSLSAFGQQALKTSQDVSHAFTNFANVSARTGSGIGEQIALTSNLRAGGSMNPGQDAAAFADMSRGLRSGFATFQPNTGAMLGATQLGVNPMSLGTMSASELNQTLVDTLRSMEKSQRNSDRTFGWLAAIVGGEMAGTVIRQSLLPEQRYEEGRKRAGLLQQWTDEDTGFFQNVTQLAERRRELKEITSDQKDIHKMEKQAWRDRGKERPYMAEARQGYGEAMREGGRAFTIGLAPLRDAWQTLMKALVGDGTKFQETLTKITQYIGGEFSGVVLIIVGSLGLLAAKFVLLIEVIVGVIKAIKHAANFEFGKAKDSLGDIGAVAKTMYEESIELMDDPKLFQDKERGYERRLREAGPSLQSHLGPNAIGEPRQIQTPVWVEVEMKGEAAEWLTTTQQQASRTGRATVLPAQGAP